MKTGLILHCLILAASSLFGLPTYIEEWPLGLFFDEETWLSGIHHAEVEVIPPVFPVGRKLYCFYPDLDELVHYTIRLLYYICPSVIVIFFSLLQIY